MVRVLLVVACALSCIFVSGAAASGSEILLKSQRWQHDNAFDPALQALTAEPLGDVSSDTVSSALRVLAGTDNFGKPALIVELTSDAGHNAAAVINGGVLLALPPGVEPDGKPRLYWLDSNGTLQFAYSKVLGAKNTSLKPANPAGSPLATMLLMSYGTEEIAPGVKVVLPSAGFTEKSPGLTWVVPANVRGDPLVNPFAPADAVGRSTRLRAVFPLKGASELPLAIYFGALSCAGQETSATDDTGQSVEVGQPEARSVSEWLVWEGDIDPAAVLGSARNRAEAAPERPKPKVEQAEQIEDVDGAVPVAQPKEAKEGPVTSTHTAKEVKPGTLALEPEVYRVPLKPITGRGRQGDMSVGPTIADAAAGPSQLSPEIGAQLATPASEMVLIPAGEFQMGSAVGPLDDRADEAPQHAVTLAAYYIDKLPVTNRQYYNFVISSGYKPEGGWQKYYEPATADLPVRGVSFADASAYARWAGKRLPTEAEWEKAARGTDARTYPWGEEWSSEILPRTDNFYGLVGSPKIASPYGVLAMCGILWQWTGSSYAAYPFNPKAAGDKKVLRGGCFSNGRNIVRCANRYAEQPGVALNTFTFRCAKDAE